MVARSIFLRLGHTIFSPWSLNDVDGRSDSMLHALRLLRSNFQHGSIPDPSRACFCQRIIERVEGTACRCFSKDENITVEFLATRYTLKNGKSIGVLCEVFPISFI